MNKFVISMTLLLSLATFSKVRAQQGFSFSVKGTPHVSFLQNSNDKDNSTMDIKPLVGVSFGIGAAYNFTPSVGIGLDVLYSKQGRRYETEGTKFNQKIDYLKIPLMFTYNTNPERLVAFVGKVGPQLSVLTGSRLLNSDGEKITDDMNDRYEGITFGGVANLGGQLRLEKNIFLTAGIRLDYDLTNAEDESYSLYPAGRERTNNMTVGLEVGLKWKLQ